jgi:hypothetical protein
MSPVGIVACALVSTVVMAYFSWFFWGVAKGYFRLRRELKEVMNDCLAAAEHCDKRGAAVFTPLPEKKHLFNILVAKKRLANNPMSDGTYMFPEDAKALWDGMPPVIVSDPDKYKDPDDIDVIGWNFDKYGKRVPSLRIVGDTVVDAEGKVVKQIVKPPKARSVQ